MVYASWGLEDFKKKNRLSWPLSFVASTDTPPTDGTGVNMFSMDFYEEN